MVLGLIWVRLKFVKLFRASQAYRFNYIYTLKTKNLIIKLNQLKLGHADCLYFTIFIAI